MRTRLIVLAAVWVVVGCGEKKKGSHSCPAPVGTVFDADGDLLTDVQEAARGTDPADADSDGDGFGDYVEVSAGTDPLASASVPTGQVARVKQIENENELIGGPAAFGRVGDWLLENDRIRAIVQRPEADQMQLGTYGGNLIDADVRRPMGEPGNDRVGMIIPYFNVATTSRPDRVVVVNDGADGGAAILRTCGEDGNLEYLDLESTFALFGIGINYDSSAELPIRVSNDYILAPGSNVVEIVTTVANQGGTLQLAVGDVIDSGGAEELYATNSQGFGSLSFAALLGGQPPTRYLGFHSPGSTWGFVPDQPKNASVSISGVTGVVAGFRDVLDVVGSDPNDFETPHAALFRVGRGQRISHRRGIVITDGTGGIAEVARVYHARHTPAATSHTGNVSDPDGPVAGVRIALLAASTDAAVDRYPETVTETDANGDYSLTVPDGEYWLLADRAGRGVPTYVGGTPGTITTLGELQLLPATKITVGPGSALPDIDFPRAAHLDVTVTTPAAGPVAARLTVVGSDPTPDDSVFRDPIERIHSSIVASALTRTGTHRFEIEAGTYDVYASRGLEWSRAQAPATVTEGATVAIPLNVGRVVDTPGWISADFHVHMLNSPDSRIPLATRALNGATEGLDAIVTSDHDFITDLGPEIAALGLSTSLACVVGNEVTTWNYGHFNVFPLTRDAADPTGGAYKWAGDRNATVSNRTPAEIFADIDLANPGTQVEQVNHARGFKLQSYYTAIELDTATLQSKSDPEFLRIAPPAGATADDTKLFYAGFDAQEVANGAGEPGTPGYFANLNDLFALLSHGLQIVGTGNSDTHTVFSGQLGYPRNYVKIANDDPAQLGANLEAFSQSIVEGQLYFTTGPQLLVTATGATTGGPGALVTPSGGSVTVEARMVMPDWVAVDTLRIYVNATGTTTPSDVDGNETAPAPAYTVDLVPLLATTSAGAGLSRRQGMASQVVTIPAGTDAWIVVTAEALDAGTPSLFPVIPNPSVKAFALSNAIYVDGNGNGTWDPPGVAALAPSTAAPAVPLKKVHAPKVITPAIREQFERLTHGAH